jgi:hypothetical protein
MTSGGIPLTAYDHFLFADTAGMMGRFGPLHTRTEQRENLGDPIQEEAVKYLTVFVRMMMISFAAFGAVQSAGAQTADPEPMLKMVTIEAGSPTTLQTLARTGIDIAAVRKGPVVEKEPGVPIQTYRVEAVVSELDEEKLIGGGFTWSDLPGKGPVKLIGEPYVVYKSFDAPLSGIKAQLHQIAATYPHVAQLKTIGRSIQKRPLLVMRLTNEMIHDDKPQVLFVATHHAREWVATEMAMRLIKYLTANYGIDARVTDLLDTVEVWIMPVGNPDGYQYTFTNERLWRKNLRDNDGDREITLADGVDPNRNFDSHWGYDDEGSSPVPTDQTYRGTAPNSEPEVQALVDFVQDNDFKFILSYHTYLDLILYPWSWQWGTTSLDDPIFVAQAGTDANPAIYDSIADKGYNPGVAADLYITNGDFVDWAYYEMGIPAQLVELTDGYDFRFPDDESMVQTVFEDNLEFALSYAESARDPAHPVSPVGITTEDVYHTPLAVSNGPDQIVEVLARKELSLTLHYDINGGAEQTTGFTERLGAVYNDRSGIYYSRYEAVVGGQSAGDSVSYRIVWSDGQLGPYSYQVLSATGNPILVLSAEDYNDPMGYTRPPYPAGSGPHYLSYYTDALDAGGYAYDVWDVDALAIPSYPEVLSHYDAVVWYTGNDHIPYEYGLGGLEQEVLSLREFLNYRNGKLLATGQDLAWLSSEVGYLSNDFFQYYLGAYVHLEGAGISLGGAPFGVVGQDGDPVLGGMSFGIDSGDGADNQAYADSFVPTGWVLAQFEHQLAARYDRIGFYDAHSGDYYTYSQQQDLSYKRLGGAFTLPAGAPTLSFWVSFDIESDWDFAFVEIREVGTDSWTTLPDLNGLTSTSTGLSCPAGWVDAIHPFLAHYMDAACNAVGTTGGWNAMTGKSGGWQHVQTDLSAYAGKDVEIFISYASDFGVQGPGIFLDDIELSGYPLEDFEVYYGSWQPAAPPAGSPDSNNWVRIESFGLPEGPVIRTSNTLYLGFGFEAIDTQIDRDTLMDRVMEYFGQ